MRVGFLIVTIVFTSNLFAQRDWDPVPVPAEPNNLEITWELVEALSDDFNYESPSPQDMGEAFYAKWKDSFINNWTGPANTYWTPDASKVTNGKLEITASRRTGTQVNFQAISAKAKIRYPAYIETRMKIMNSVMANAVWLLNDKSTEEIDIVEGYGATYANSNGTSRDWFAKRMHLSHHTFIRDPFQDYQPKDAGSWHFDGTYWKDNFRIIGVYWRDPFHLEYYIDGKLVRTVSGASMIDPNEYLGGNGLSEEETLIISGASQGWQVNDGVWPTDAELAVGADNVFKVDWIRTYQRVDVVIPADTVSNVLAIPIQTGASTLMFSNPLGDLITVKKGADVEKIDFFNLSGRLIKSFPKQSLMEGKLSTRELPKGIYLMRATNEKGSIASYSVIKQ